MGRDRSFCGANAMVSTPVAQLGKPKLAGNLNKGIWSRLKLGAYTNSTTSVAHTGTLTVDTGNDTVDPDTVNGGYDYPQYSVIKIKGGTGSSSSNQDFDLPNNMIRFSWPVRDIFGREVTKFDAPYIHMFWFDLPMAEGAASGMQDPWQADTNTLSGTARPDSDPDIQIIVALSELHAGEYASLANTADVSADAWPMLGAGMLAKTADGWRARMADCRGARTDDIYDTAGVDATMRTMYGSIMVAPDEAMAVQALWLQSTATDNQVPVWSRVGQWRLPNNDYFRDISSTNNIYWTLNIGRTVVNPATDEQAVVFNLYVASIPLFPVGGTTGDALWEKISPIDYVSGAGGADGS